MDFYPLNRKPEQVAQESILRPGLFKDIAKSIGITITAFTLLASFNLGDETITHYRSSSQSCAAPEGPNNFNIVNANIRYNSSYAGQLVQETQAEIGTFQETRKGSVQKIVDHVACSEATFAPADYAVDWTSGGLGNTTLYLDQEKDDVMRQIEGTLDVVDFLSGLVRMDTEKMAAAYKESRSALLSRFRVEISGREVDLNAMNFHTAAASIGDSQLRNVFEFANDEMNNRGAINIMFGDANRTPEELTKFLGKNTDWVVSQIGPTSRDSGKQIDHVIYKPTVIIDDVVYIVIIENQLLDKPGSDHRAINTKIRLLPLLPLSFMMGHNK